MPIPPGWDTSYTECFGFSMEDLFEEGARSNEARMRAIGLPLDDIAHFPFPMIFSPRERGEQALTLLRAGLLGERNGPVRATRATLRVFFDLLARNARGEEVPRGTTIQWDFRDAEPWYLQLDGVRQDRDPGPRREADRPPAAELRRLRRSRLAPRPALRARRARPHAPGGDPRILLKLQRLFA